jgi:hypothetical protein
MANEKGNAYNLTMFDGTGDLHTLSLEQIQAKILNHTLQDGPVKVQAASFSATSAPCHPQQNLRQNTLPGLSVHLPDNVHQTVPRL